MIGVKDKTLKIVGTDISRLTFNGQPTNKTEGQQLRMLGDLVKAIKLEEPIKTDGRNLFLL